MLTFKTRLAEEWSALRTFRAIYLEKKRKIKNYKQQRCGTDGNVNVTNPEKEQTVVGMYK